MPRPSAEAAHDAARRAVAEALDRVRELPKSIRTAQAQIKLEHVERLLAPIISPPDPHDLDTIPDP